MKKILFVNPGPFASLTDTYYYFLLMNQTYELSYVGFDENRKINEIKGTKLIHIKGNSRSILQKYRFFKEINGLIKTNNYDLVFINYFLGCSFIRLISKINMVLDIRTSYIIKSKIKRIIYNTILTIESHLFKNVTIISAGLKKQLHISPRAHILPLGATALPLIKKDFTTLKIIYIGTFHERNIVNTIFGFADFISKYNQKYIAHYIIIGFGTEQEINNIKNAINLTKMNDFISFKGEVRYPELTKYLNENNIGLSYIPLKKFFMNQPPTKTFEYLLSGNAVIATKTNENKKIINGDNGILIGETIEEISLGLQHVYINRFNFNSQKIQQESLKYSWENIINKNLIPFLEEKS